ncbi:MAG: hypothetical protein ACM3U2_01365 [Deltaproteobacteria bacterium]
MNCLTARQTLELARRDEPEAAGSCNRATVEDAARHLEACPTCQTAVRRQRQFDYKVGVMIREAPVPADLKDRLLARLEEDDRSRLVHGEETAQRPAPPAPGTEPAVAAPAAGVVVPVLPGRAQAGARRRWLGAVALSAACLVAGFGAWSLWPVPPSINPDDVAAELATSDIRPANLAAFTRFANGLAPKVPDTMKSDRLVLPPRRLYELDVAVYFFPLSSRRGAPLDGRLAVIPKRRVVAGKVPQATSFLAPPPHVTYYKNGFCVTAWVEGDFVYICCLRGGENELYRLLPIRTMPI